MKKLLATIAATVSVFAVAAPAAEASHVPLNLPGCRAHLAGNIGDNDIQAWGWANGMGFSHWDSTGTQPGTGTYASHRMITHAFYFWQDSYYGAIAYCMVRDGRIVDTMDYPPAGW